MSPETGTCRGSFQRWYFNSESGQCEDFEYGGCDANANNFETKEDCENHCHKPVGKGNRNGFSNHQIALRSIFKNLVTWQQDF